MSYFPTRKRLFTPAIMETAQSDQLRAHSELAGMSDGSRWVEVGTNALPVGTSLHSSVVYNGKMWVIGGSTGVVTRKVYYSTDGITWTEAGVDALPVGTYIHSSVVYQGKMWVIGGFTGVTLRKVYYSTDGITWTQAGVDALPVATWAHSSVVYNGKMWVIGGYAPAATRKVYSTIPQQSGMILDGPITHKRTSTGINYTVLGPDHYIGCTAGGITITLPAVANMSGRVIVVKDESGAAAATPIIVQASGAELIDGINTYTLTSNFQCCAVVCTGTSWKIY
jgi:hypothetical protein